MEKIKATQISTKALKIRKLHLGAAPHQPICPYALCEAMGIDVRFVNIPSFEGMYIAEQNLILISADRPEGRKRFTCAHEIGHHVLGHGTVIDEILESGSNKEEEDEADYFASIILMPASAVTRALQQYRKGADGLLSNDAYILSQYFGVSYQALLGHMCFNLRLITYKRYQDLKKINLKDIRRSICGIVTNNQVVSVGAWWEEKAIDIEVGDYIVSQTKLEVDGPSILAEVSGSQPHTYQAVSPGITRVHDKEWSSFLKISKHKFQGLYQYKYDEDCE